MSAMSTRRITLWHVVAAMVVLGGLAITVHRAGWGLGAVTNLNDQVPWGLWKGFNTITGIALAGGGFTMAFLVHIVGDHELRDLVRPAILIATPEATSQHFRNRRVVVAIADVAHPKALVARAVRLAVGKRHHHRDRVAAPVVRDVDALDALGTRMQPQALANDLQACVHVFAGACLLAERVRGVLARHAQQRRLVTALRAQQRHAPTALLAQHFGQAVGMADHAESAPHHGREQPEKQDDGLRIRAEPDKQGIGK